MVSKQKQQYTTSIGSNNRNDIVQVRTLLNKIKELTGENQISTVIKALEIYYDLAKNSTKP